MDWAAIKAKEVINNNPDIKRWGVAMDIEPFAKALRDAYDKGYQNGIDNEKASEVLRKRRSDGLG